MARTAVGVTLDSIRHLAVVDIPTGGAVLGLSRDQAYRAARAGTLPTIKLSERRMVVPVAQLVRLLEGVDERRADAAAV